MTLIFFLSRSQRALLAVDKEGDPPRPDLQMLGEVIVHVLATGDKAARFDGEVSDDAGAAALLGGLDQHRLLASQRVPHDIAGVHRARLPFCGRLPCSELKLQIFPTGVCDYSRPDAGRP